MDDLKINQRTPAPETMSAKERKRAGKAASQLSKIKGDGYNIKEVTISPLFANLMALFWGFLFSIPTLIIYYIHNGYIFGGTEETTLETIIIWVVYFVAIVIHELIHGTCMYLFNGKNKDTIEYGINSGMPYCTCQSPISKKKYFIVLVMPTIILGIVLSAISIIVGKFWYLFMTVMMIAGGGGDFTICAKLLQRKEKDLMVVDHPYKCGFFAISKTYDSTQSDEIIAELTKVSQEQNKAPDTQKKKISKKKMIVAAVVLIVASFLGGLTIGYLTEPGETQETNQETQIETTVSNQ